MSVRLNTFRASSASVLNASMEIGVSWLRSSRRRAVTMPYSPGRIAKQTTLSGVEQREHDGTTAILATATNNGTKPAHGIA
jgi:hypothetical protein